MMGVKGYSALIVSAKDTNTIHLAAEEIRSILRQQHKIKSADDDDFSLFTQNEVSQTAKATSSI
ncbi:hypothetical protein KAW80_00595 [Candidatus Babeliales bacterium]|nr:hypothetical protein [Candidatus Babeliales bacterium]